MQAISCAIVSAVAVAAALYTSPVAAAPHGAAKGDATCAGKAASLQKESVLLQVHREKPVHTLCAFAVEPETPYYWDPNCTLGDVGCWADGVNVECRFCNYEGVPCPSSAWRPSRKVCKFDNAPESAYYWEPECPHIDGGLGCKADGTHWGCRFCGGEGDYKSIECKVEECTFSNEPLIPYYFDHNCTDGDLGCLADGIHLGCRYCGARPYEGVPCPVETAVPEQSCWFRNLPSIPYFWDETCEMGMLGCWADGIHEKCRFCGKNHGKGGVYSEIACPEENETTQEVNDDEQE